MTDEIQDFLIAAVPNRDVRRVLATVVFIDELGPRPMRPRPGAEPRTSQLIERFRGRTVRHDGGSILVTFDEPARAVRCAFEMVRRAQSSGLAVRAGVHTGECDATSEDLCGVAVDVARGIADAARPGQVLVSQTVRDLVLGSSIEFRETCSYRLESLPSTWRAYAVVDT